MQHEFDLVLLYLDSLLEVFDPFAPSAFKSIMQLPGFDNLHPLLKKQNTDFSKHTPKDFQKTHRTQLRAAIPSARSFLFR